MYDSRLWLRTEIHDVSASGSITAASMDSEPDVTVIVRHVQGRHLCVLAFDETGARQIHVLISYLLAINPNPPAAIQLNPIQTSLPKYGRNIAMAIDTHHFSLAGNARVVDIVAYSNLVLLLPTVISFPKEK